MLAFRAMANATLSPRQLATLLSRLDECQRVVTAIRGDIIAVMADRRRPVTNRRAARKTQARGSARR